MPLPKELTTVTRTSKIIAVMVFITVPFIGFLLGMKYEKEKYQNTQMQDTLYNSPRISPTKHLTEVAPLAKPTVVQENNINKWKTFSSIKGKFSIKYAPQIVIEEKYDAGEGYVMFQLKGPTQGDMTEFYDGIRLTFRSDYLGNEDLKTYIEQSIKKQKDYLTVTKSVHMITLNGINGYSYSGTQLGEFTYIYLPLDKNTFLEIADSSNDPTHQGYSKIVEKMLSTLTLK